VYFWPVCIAYLITFTRCLYETRPIPYRPAVILHMRNLDPARAKREREIDHLADPVDVGTVHHRIHGERELVSHDLGRECPFPGKCARIAGDVVGGPSVAVLDEICTWSSPASANAPRVLSVIPTAEVIRLV
jgi:hypothetical protein